MSAFLFLCIPLAVTVAIVQSSVTASLRVFGSSPDLVLLLTVAWSLVRGRREGLVVAMTGGIVLDVFSGGAFGLSVVGLVVVATLAGFGQTNVFGTAWFLPYLAIGIATIIYDVLLMALLSLGGYPVSWMQQIGQVVLVSALLNAVCMSVVYPVVRWLQARLRPQVVGLT